VCMRGYVERKRHDGGDGIRLRRWLVCGGVRAKAMPRARAREFNELD
jgi:hypothetical protein